MEKRYEILCGRSRSDGGVYGLSLIEAGYEVNFLDINSDHVNEIKENGFRLSGIVKQKVHKINISNNENNFKNSSDIVLFHAHTTGTKSAARSAATVLKPDGYAITLQKWYRKHRGFVESSRSKKGCGRC